MNTFNRVEMKMEAKTRITGKVLNLFLANFVVFAFGAIGAIPYVGFLISLAFMPLNIGVSYFYLNFIEKEKIDYNDILFTYKFKDLNIFFNHLGTILLMVLFIILWSLLFLIPGIIKTIAYSQAFYIKTENPEMSPMECLRASEDLMRNNKMDYFVLQLSFIGWFILCVLTFGLGFIYVLPYHSVTNAMYYRHLSPLAKIEIIENDTEIKNYIDNL